MPCFGHTNHLVNSLLFFKEQPDMTILSSDILKQIQEQQNGAATNGKSSANTAKNF